MYPLCSNLFSVIVVPKMGLWAMVRPAFSHPWAILRPACPKPCSTAQQPQLTNRSPSSQSRPTPCICMIKINTDASTCYPTSMSYSSATGRIRFFLFRSGFFQSCHMQYLRRLRNHTSTCYPTSMSFTSTTSRSSMSTRSAQRSSVTAVHSAKFAYHTCQTEVIQPSSLHFSQLVTEL